MGYMIQWTEESTVLSVLAKGKLAIQGKKNNQGKAQKTFKFYL